MFSISSKKQSSSILSSISELEPFLNDFQYDDSIPLVTGGGGVSPLDLYNGHLPFSHQYQPATRQGYNDPVNWFVHSSGHDPSSELQIVLKIQPFKAGGYEAVLSHQDLHRLASLMDSPSRTGKREPRVMSEADCERSVSRSKTKIRHLIKSMGLCCLFTGSLRENDPDTYRTPEDWGRLWDKFCRLCRKAGINFEYVAVLEKHKKGNYHLHAAITRVGNYRLMRRLWYIAAGGRGDERGASTPGNIDLSYKHNMTNYQRCAGVARYISKYITKQLGVTEFNKKRYWSSKHKLPSVVRYVLKSSDFIEGLQEMCALLGLSVMTVIESVYQFFTYRDGKRLQGAWFSYEERMSLPCPF